MVAGVMQEEHLGTKRLATLITAMDSGALLLVV